MYCFTTDYRPVNAVTRPMFWPLHSIGAELNGTRSSKDFAGIDFCSGYWKAVFHPDSQLFFALSSAEGLVMLTPTTQGGCNSIPNFQEMVKQCFADLKQQIEP